MTYNVLFISSFPAQSMDLSTYLVNGEWQVISTNAKRVVSYYKCCPEPYPTVNYYLHIRRRTLYYGMFEVLFDKFLYLKKKENFSNSS